MIERALSAAIASARTSGDVVEVLREGALAFAAGEISDDEARALLRAVRARVASLTLERFDVWLSRLVEGEDLAELVAPFRGSQPLERAEAIAQGFNDEEAGSARVGAWAVVLEAGMGRAGARIQIGRRRREEGSGGR